jgi:hypothetical protein
VGDYIYLETSALRHTPALAPLRSRPYAIEKVVANGNDVYLEGFRHPFNVEFITPTLCFANGINPHLTQHVLPSGQGIRHHHDVASDAIHGAVDLHENVASGLADNSTRVPPVETAGEDGTVQILDA